MINELMRRRALLGAGDSLPYDAEVEYLQSSGTQYINTGIIGANDIGFYVRAMRTIYADRQFIGLRETTGNTRLFIGTGFYGWEAYYAMPSTTTNVIFEWQLNYLNDKKFKEDGVEKNTLANLTFTPTLPIFVFALNYIGSAQGWTGRMYAAKITKGSSVIMDLIPVRVGQVGYMYDKVSGQLFGNAGSGNFILGNDINT